MKLMIGLLPLKKGGDLMARSNNSSYNTHMDLSDRAAIEKGLTSGSTKTAIAKALGYRTPLYSHMY